MIVIDCIQGEADWFKARAGYPTASGFSRIFTAAHLDKSAQAQQYLFDLVAERLLGVAIDGEKWTGSQWTERGRELEQAAVDAYEFITDTQTDEVGFVLRDDRLAGCSPDRLVGVAGGLEIKCPGAGKHVGYLMGGVLPAEYRLQVQASLWVTGRLWWDFMSYNPALPPFIHRVKPDPKCFDAFSNVMPQFVAEIGKAVAELRPKVAA